MQYLYKKMMFVALLAGVFMCASVVHAGATSTSVTSSAASVAPTIGTTEVEKMIVAEKVRLVQLKKRNRSVPGIAHTLKKGSSGEEVKLLQKFLALYATSSAPTVTGYYGTMTARAVKEFQKKELLEPAGIVGPKTRVRIFALSKLELARTKVRTASTISDAVPDITDVLFSTDVGEDGSGVDSATTFASTTKNMYAILKLANAQQETAIGLIRLYNGTYVDSTVTHPSRSGLRYMHFQWSLKAGGARVPGLYTMTFYVNGKKAKTASFTIQ